MANMKKHFTDVKKDWFIDLGPNKKSKAREFLTCYVIKHEGIKEQVVHPLFSDAKFLITPKSLSNVPLMCARKFKGKVGYDIISKERGDKIIAKCTNMYRDFNEDIIDLNEQYMGVKGYKPQKWNKPYSEKHMRNVSPYTVYVDMLAKKSSKKKKEK